MSSSCVRENIRGWWLWATSRQRGSCLRSPPKFQSNERQNVSAGCWLPSAGDEHAFVPRWNWHSSWRLASMSENCRWLFASCLRTRRVNASPAGARIHLRSLSGRIELPGNNHPSPPTCFIAWTRRGSAPIDSPQIGRLWCLTLCW